ncbi:MAG: hypothetical protein ACK5DW_04045, partial [Burkholderiales bacterium]
MMNRANDQRSIPSSQDVEDALEDSNSSANLSIHEISDPSKRKWLYGGMAAASASLLAPLARAASANTHASATKPSIAQADSSAAQATKSSASRLGFKAVEAQDRDGLWVPEGYEAQIAFLWGEPIGA